MSAFDRRLLDSIQGHRLLGLRMDLQGSAIELHFEGRGLRFEGICSSTLLGPWDGQPAQVEACQLVHEDEEGGAIELRLRYPEVPRTYRVVCRGLRQVDPD